MLSTLQEMSGATNKASIFFIKCERSDETGAVEDEVHSLLPGYEVRPLRDYISLMTSSISPGLSSFINIMISIAVSIGFLVIFLSMYTTIIERTREIGVLKSLGASKSYIVEIVLSETTLLCLLGVAAGVGLSYSAEGDFYRHFSFDDHFDHGEMDFHCGRNCAGGRAAGLRISVLDRQPQRSRGSARLRIIFRRDNQ